MASEEWLRKCHKHKRFTETPIGKAFVRFDNALQRAWSFDAGPNEARAKNAWAVEGEAREELLKLLYEAAGIETEGETS